MQRAEIGREKKSQNRDRRAGETTRRQTTGGLKRQPCGAGAVERQRGSCREKERYEQTQRQEVGPCKDLEEGNRQSGPVVNRRHNWQIGGHSQTHPQRLGTDTPAWRDKGTEEEAEAGRHLEGQRTIGREREREEERLIQADGWTGPGAAGDRYRGRHSQATIDGPHTDGKIA